MPQRRPRHDKHAFGDIELGRCMFYRVMALNGILTENDWRRFLIAATKAMGMAPVDKAVCWRYPVGTCGGHGMTIVQPITESFLAVDAWPDHGGAYLFVCSCKPFLASLLAKTFKRFGLREVHALGSPGMLELG